MAAISKNWDCYQAGLLFLGQVLLMTACYRKYIWLKVFLKPNKKCNISQFFYLWIITIKLWRIGVLT